MPKYTFHRITDIPPAFLGRLGIRLLMLDLDNTVMTYGEDLPSGDVLQWAADIQNSGVKLFIVSNSRRVGRVERFAEFLGIGYIKAAGKPSPDGIIAAMREARSGAQESAFAGDQIFTDTLAANRAGVASIVVRPLCFSNLFIALRYVLEIPFRAVGGIKRNGYVI